MKFDSRLKVWLNYAVSMGRKNLKKFWTGTRKRARSGPGSGPRSRQKTGPEADHDKVHLRKSWSTRTATGTTQKHENQRLSNRSWISGPSLELQDGSLYHSTYCSIIPIVQSSLSQCLFRFSNFYLTHCWWLNDESSTHRSRVSQMKTLLSFKSSILSDKQSLPFSNSTMHILPRH